MQVLKSVGLNGDKFITIRFNKAFAVKCCVNVIRNISLKKSFYNFNFCVVYAQE